jgi:Tol biopolymer transport system component
MWKKFRIFLFIALSVAEVSAQLPETDLWLFKLKTEDKKLILGEGKNITSRKGYDNQPCFAPDNKSILYVSIREDNQADVYKYDIGKGQSFQLTKTKESEYSPNYTPGYKSISCVVVEADSTQRLWLYNLDGTVKKCYNEEIDSIGYYSWLTNDTLLYYKLTEPHSLHMFIEMDKTDKWLCNHPMRAFKSLGRNNFMYGIKDSLSVQYRSYNSVLKKSDEYTNHKSKSEDFDWNKIFGLVKSEGAQLLRYDPNTKSWIVMFDFASSGIKKITRFAFDSKNKNVVIVDNN